MSHPFRALSHTRWEPKSFVKIQRKPKARLFPLAGYKVPAGFPSPAENWMRERINLDEFFRVDDFTFQVRVAGHSVEDKGLLDGDIAIVNKMVDARHGDIVVAIIDGQETLKVLHNLGEGKWALRKATSRPGYQDIEIGEGMDVEIWGVVVGAMRRFR